MSEEAIKMSVFDIFKQSAQTYEQALAKRESEKPIKKIERYRISDDGDYLVRILPLCPHIGEDGKPIKMDRTGYEFDVRQQFLKIKLPVKKGSKKSKVVQIPVIQTTQKGVGLPVDLIDTYVKIAKEFDEDGSITKKVTSNGFDGGLKWNWQHAMYLLDLDKKRKGPLLFMSTYAQYHAMDDAKKDVWDQLIAAEADNREQCPLCSFAGAYPLKITRSDNNGKTEYKFSLQTIGKPDVLKEEELKALLDAPRIDDEIYKYTRYQFEATLEFLKQYDEMLDISVCEEDDFKAAVDQLRDALPKDDTSHFDILKASDKNESGSAKNEVVTIDTLWDENDAIEANGLGKDSDEYNELREKIVQYILDNKLDVRVGHSKSNAQILEDIEDVLDNNASPVSKEDESKNSNDEISVDEPKDEPSHGDGVSRRRTRPLDDESNEGVSKQEEGVKAEESEEKQQPRRRRRPVGDEGDADNIQPEVQEDNVSAEQSSEDAPRRRRRR